MASEFNKLIASNLYRDVDMSSCKPTKAELEAFDGCDLDKIVFVCREILDLHLKLSDVMEEIYSAHKYNKSKLCEISEKLNCLIEDLKVKYWVLERLCADYVVRG